MIEREKARRYDAGKTSRFPDQKVACSKGTSGGVGKFREREKTAGRGGEKISTPIGLPLRPGRGRMFFSDPSDGPGGGKAFKAVRR